jgi:hypothetical protein
MRKWLVEETGQFDRVIQGKYYINPNGAIARWETSFDSAGLYILLNVTEVTEEQANSFDEWNW